MKITDDTIDREVEKIYEQLQPMVWDHFDNTFLTLLKKQQQSLERRAQVLKDFLDSPNQVLDSIKQQLVQEFTLNEIYKLCKYAQQEEEYFKSIERNSDRTEGWDSHTYERFLVNDFTNCVAFFEVDLTCDQEKFKNILTEELAEEYGYYWRRLENSYEDA